MESAALDFMNSLYRDYRGGGRAEDRFADPAWRESFLARWGLDVQAPLSAATLEDLDTLRAALWRIGEALNAGRGPETEDLNVLNEALGGAHMRRRLVSANVGYRLEVVPADRDWVWIRAELAASFAELLASHDPSRIKLCGNADCRWIFYDESKSRSRRWCADVCGNLMKVRKHRARARDGSAVGPADEPGS
jgi:predicted RNA-binding Zn ribbon-like protein